MNVRPHLLSRALVATVLVSVSLSGCSGSGSDSEPKKPKASTSATGTHDGALPISTTLSWMDALRQGQGQIVCGFSTPEFQTALVETAASLDLTKRKAECAPAAEALAKTDTFPVKADAFDVESALDDTTDLTLTTADDKKFDVSLVKTDEQWFLHSFAPLD